ncbi:GntR family transcriptional regulator [Xenorhabdus sp. DI]|uniref:GntR family transcriptional regulator n=1 Tax=Xenorhabdus doucetiae TaxID=351671 RepID=UPI0019844697|nr:MULTISPECIES: GntR family transcriptional regulator [unclassified Xenorhabdus]MBD2786212.1 GntR family transcriptional regulator [Xenorhabdus sp. 3]MBD2789896.1 GntR family transcriptional regulator [Xenorhabdus sp. DI]
MEIIKTSYVDRVYLQIKNKIINNEFKPNEKLCISKLTDQLNVSSTPIREALNRLLHEQFVIKGDNRGFYTRSLDYKEQLELVILREILLVSIIKIYLDKASQERLNDFSKKIEALINKEASCNAQKINSIDNEFTFLILDVINNNELSRLYTNCIERNSYPWHTFIKQNSVYFLSMYDKLFFYIRKRDLSNSKGIIKEIFCKLKNSNHIELLCLVSV